MIWEEWEKLTEEGVITEGQRVWLFGLHYENLERNQKPYRIVHFTEAEYKAVEGWGGRVYYRLHKVGKRGRATSSTIYGEDRYWSWRDNRRNKDSEYLIEVFTSKREALTAYRECIEYWQTKINEERDRFNTLFDEMIEKTEDYYTEASK